MIVIQTVPARFSTFRVTDRGEEPLPNLVAADASHARALITTMYGGDVASRARIESLTHHKGKQHERTRHRKARARHAD